jgi:G-protein signaling modulator 2
MKPPISTRKTTFSSYARSALIYIRPGFHSKAMNIARALGDKAIEAQTYYSLGNTYTLLQDYTISIDYYLRHLQIAKQLTDQLGESRAYWSLGNAYAALGEIENAISYATKHLEIAKQVTEAVDRDWRPFD